MSDPKEVAARALALTKQIEAVFYHDHPGGAVQARSKVQVLLIDAFQSLSADLERVTAERDEARLLVTEANNSLYGSQGYFHSLNGGPFDKYHLATGIENLKASSRENWRKITAAEARISTLTEALAAVRRRTKSARGAIESDQVVDKDVHGSLTWVLETIDAAIRALPTQGEQP